MENQEKNSQMIVDDVISQIGSGRLKISEALPSEREMAQLYHVSRSCVGSHAGAGVGHCADSAQRKDPRHSLSVEPFIQRISPLLFAQGA
ncbi:MAG: GntR family transcriptional regulator [Holdemania massiliensis]